MIDSAVRAIHTNVVRVRGNSDNFVDAFDIDDNPVIVDRPLVDAEIQRLQDIYDNAQYARSRATAYPPMADQLDDIFHNGVAGWKKTIQAVKDTYPKP
jgi:hypothetical protein